MRKCWKHLPENQDKKTDTHYEYTIQFRIERFKKGSKWEREEEKKR